MLGSLLWWLEILRFGVFTCELTQSAFWVARLTIPRMLPLALFGLAFGTLEALFSRRSGLLVGHGLLFRTSAILLAISYFGAIAVWHLATASFINGSAWANDMPLRRCLVGDIAGPPRMVQAMSLDALAGYGCQLAGAGSGGVLLVPGGLPAVWCGVATLCALAWVALAGLGRQTHRTPGNKTRLQFLPCRRFPCRTRIPAPAGDPVGHHLVQPLIWPVLSMLAVIGQQRLRLSTQTYSLLPSRNGVASLIGAIVLMLLVSRLRHGHVYVASVLCLIAMQRVLAWRAHPTMTGAALLALGFCQPFFAIMQCTLVFFTAPPSRRHEAICLASWPWAGSPNNWAHRWQLWRSCPVQAAGTKTKAWPSGLCVRCRTGHRQHQLSIQLDLPETKRNTKALGQKQHKR